VKNNVSRFYGLLCIINYPCQLSLAIPPRVCKMSTGDGTTTAGEKTASYA